MKNKDKKVNQYAKPKNKNAVIILSTGFFLWGKSMGYKGLSVGEVCVNNDICQLNSYGQITEKENIGKAMICNSHHAFLEETCKPHTNMSASGLAIPAFNVSDTLDSFLRENEISAIYDVDTLALINKINKEGENKVSALIFNVPDTVIDINTLYGFLTAFTGKNNKTESIGETKTYGHINENLKSHIFMDNDNFKTLNTYINGSFYFKYSQKSVHISRSKGGETMWHEEYPTDREEMEILKKQGLSDVQIANKYNKHPEIVGYNRVQWGNYPSYKLYDGMYIPVYAGDGVNDADCQLDFTCHSFVIANDDICDDKLKAILHKHKSQNTYILTDNVNLVNNLKSKYLTLDEFGYPVNIAIIIAQANAENIGDILKNNQDIKHVYYHNQDHIKDFEKEFRQKEVNLTTLSLGGEN